MTELPSGWVTKTIGEVATFNRKKPQDKKNSEEPVSFVPMPKVYETLNRITLDESISHQQGQKRSLTYFEDGDVIFAKITPCMENGKIAIAKFLLNGCAYGSTEFHVLTVGPEILAEYLFYFMVSDDFRADAASAMTGTVGQRRVPKSYLEQHLIPLPPLPEQQKIVEILEDHLSRLDAALADVKLAKLKAAQFRRSLLRAAFTGNLSGGGTRLVTELPPNWKVSKIGDVAEVIRGVTYSKADTLSENDKNSVPLLRATNLEVDAIDFNNMVYVPKKVVKEQQFLRIDDIFLAASSGSISVVGKNAQVVKTNGATFGAFCSVIRPKAIHPKFLALWVQSPEIREHWSATAKGTNINNLKPSDILDTNVPLPPLPEQQKIVEILEDHLSRLDASVAIADAMDKQSSSLRRSLLQAAFTGQLTNEVASV